MVEPRLSSATRWNVTADAGEIDGLEFAYLSGAEGPQVESRSGWDVDGVEIRMILDFAAGFIEWVLSEDPIAAWIDACVAVRPIVNGGPLVATRDAYLRFQNWALTEGYKPEKLPARFPWRPSHRPW